LFINYNHGVEKHVNIDVTLKEAALQRGGGFDL